MGEEFAKWILSAAGGGLACTWGMLRWTNGRIRKLEMNRVTPEDCHRHIAAISEIHKDIWQELKQVSEAVARIEGYLRTGK